MLGISKSKSRELVARPPAKELAEAGVLQVVGNLAPHGVARATVDVSKALSARGARSVIASAGGALMGEARIGGAEHAEIKPLSANPVGMVGLSRQIGRLVKDHRIDIVHVRDPLAAWAALRAARRARVYSVSTVSGLPLGSGWLDNTYAGAMTNTDHVVAISDFIADYLRRNKGVPNERLSVIHRGIDLARFNPAAIKAQRLIDLARRYALPDDKTIVLAAGRLAPRKGFDVLVDALAKLEREDVFCLILGEDAGDGTTTRKLERRIEEAGLGGRVRLGGHCDDMPAAYMLADVVAVPTIEPEAFGRTCVEAQAMGRPVVASAHGAARELVMEGETGWLVPAGEAAPLAEAIGRALLLDAEARRTMALKTRSQVSERFGRDRMCEQVLTLYERLLAGQ